MATRSILICISLGVITSLVLAWVASACGDRARGKFTLIDPEEVDARVRWYGNHRSTRFSERYSLQRVQLAPGASSASPEDGLRSAHDVPGAVAPWAQWHLARCEPGTSFVRVDAAGWPMRCLSASAHTVHGRAYASRMRWGIKLPYPAQPTTPSAPALLPLRPIWPGLIFDTVVWGIIWSVFLLTPGATRRALRHRAGRCTRCGYDLKGLQGAPACPECGALSRGDA